MPLFVQELDLSDDYPTIEPSLKLDFANARALDPRITFTRPSVSTYAGKDGLIKTAGENEPRFDHDLITGESLGLLIEESRTNLLTYSDITSGEGLGTGWAIGGNRASKGPNATAPDGTLSAWNSVYNGTSGDASVYKVGGEVTTSNSTVYTLSVFAKVPSSNTYLTGVRLRTFNDNHSANFNLLTGTIVGGVEGTTTQRMEAYPNGWYRCSITFTSGTDGNQGVQFYMINPSNSTSMNDSNANGEQIYYWGAQLEQGSFPTSYIPTSGATATRGSDVMTLSGDNFSSWNNQSQGTYLMSIKNNSTDLSGLPSPARTQSIFLFLGNGGHFTKNTTSNVQVSQLSVNTTDFRKWAFYHDGANGYGMSVDGSTPINSSQPIGTSDTSIVFNDIQGETSFYLKSLFYYPKRLSNAQLKTLTKNYL